MDSPRLIVSVVLPWFFVGTWMLTSAGVCLHFVFIVLHWWTMQMHVCVKLDIENSVEWLAFVNALHFVICFCGCWMSLQHAVCWLLNVPAISECISRTDLLRQFYVLPHWDRSCRSNFPSHPVTVYWHRANQSQRWPIMLGAWQGGAPICKSLVWLDPWKIPAKAGFEPRIFRSQGRHLNH